MSKIGLHEELELLCRVPESDLNALFRAAESSLTMLAMQAAREASRQRCDWQLPRQVAVRTQKEVGEIMGISAQRVAFYEKRALAKLRVALANLRP